MAPSRYAMQEVIQLMHADTASKEIAAFFATTEKTNQST